MRENASIAAALAAILCFPACDRGAPEEEPATAAPSALAIAAGPGAARELALALVAGPPGRVIELGPGTFDLARGLSVDTSNVTLRGAGMDRTILSFASQEAGSQGILATGSGFTIEDLAILDTKGDGFKAQGAHDITIRRVRVDWSGGPRTENGAYGIYPVECARVLIEGCLVRHASDAGIYVGQSQDAIIRTSRAERNVAGIEVENSRRVDVFDNDATGNTGGILVFDLPGLPRQNGGEVRVFENRIRANDSPNFADPGSIVANVAPGTGLLVMANDTVEIFENQFEDNGTIQIAIVSTLVTEMPGWTSGKSRPDPNHEPYPERIHVHDNRYRGGGDRPAGALGALLALLVAPSRRIPDIVWDGQVDPARFAAGEPPPEWGIRIAESDEIEFVNLNLGRPGAGISRDRAPHRGSYPRLPGVARVGARE